MTFTYSTPAPSPFGYSPSFGPAAWPNCQQNFGQSYAQPFGQYGECSPWHWPAHSNSNHFADGSNTWGQNGWTPSQYGAPAAFTNHGWGNPSWFGNAAFNHPAWKSNYVPSNGSSHYPNNWYGAQAAWPGHAWNQFGSFNPFNSNFAPASGASSWYSHPGSYSPFGSQPYPGQYQAHFQPSSPWFDGAQNSWAWFAPHNWAATNSNPAWSQPGHAAPGAGNNGASPYAVASPASNPASRDAA